MYLYPWYVLLRKKLVWRVCRRYVWVCPGISGNVRVHSNPKDVLAHKNKFWRLCRRYVWVCLWYVRVCPGVSVPLVRFIAEKNRLAGMPEVCLGVSGYVRVCLGSFKPQRRFSAQKLILAVMPEVCLGMSVVCPGMSGFILNH